MDQETDDEKDGGRDESAFVVADKEILNDGLC